jgi:hypothetical protein
MGNLLNYTTEVPASRSIGQIRDVMVRTYIDALSAGHDSTTALVLARNAGQIMKQAEGCKVAEITAS